MTDSRSIDSFDPEAQAYIRELRSEAAKYRTERNDYQARYTEVQGKYTEAGQLLRDANTKLDEFTAARDAAEKASADLAALAEKHSRVAIWAQARGIDLADAARLQGATEEEWKADAATLAERFGATPAGVPKNPGAGAKPNSTPKPDGFSEAFRKAGLL